MDKKDLHDEIKDLDLHKEIKDLKAVFIINRINDYMPENVNPYYWMETGFDIAYQQALKDYFEL